MGGSAFPEPESLGGGMVGVLLYNRGPYGLVVLLSRKDPEAEPDVIEIEPAPPAPEVAAGADAIAAGGPPIPGGGPGGRARM